MIGYVGIYHAELKVKEVSKYRAYYCGLCQRLYQKFSNIARLAVSYDFTFLLMLHGSLYGERVIKNKYACPIHLISKNIVLQNYYTEYAADMNMYMLYKKIQDDKLDDNNLMSFLVEPWIKIKLREIYHSYKDKFTRIDKLQDKLNEYERQNNKDIEILSSAFGNILSEIFVIKEDEWAKYLRRLGHYLGKFIYILDAYEDKEKDLKKGSFNPLFDNNKKDLYTENEIKDYLLMSIASACTEFEKLPCVRDYNILHNILYLGVWNKYNEIRQKRLRKAYV